MRLSIDKAGLVKALAHVASVVERRNTIPILSNVLLSSRNNELKLTKPASARMDASFAA